MGPVSIGKLFFSLGWFGKKNQRYTSDKSTIGYNVYNGMYSQGMKNDGWPDRISFKLVRAMFL